MREKVEARDTRSGRPVERLELRHINCFDTRTERERESKREQERARESKREQERGAVFAFILAGLSGLALTRKGSPSVYSGSIRRRRFEMSAVSAPR